MSLYKILLQLRMMEVVATTAAIGCAKLRSNRHHQQTNTSILQAGALPVTQQTASQHSFIHTGIHLRGI